MTLVVFIHSFSTFINSFLLQIIDVMPKYLLSALHVLAPPSIVYGCKTERDFERMHACMQS